jgi:hypothetical protein
MLDFASSPEVRDAGEAAPSVSDTEILDAYSNAVTSVADAVGPAVVRVEVRASNGRPAGVGSGVIIAPDGLVLTNSHVVEGAKDIWLQDADGHLMEARSLGEDSDTDWRCCAPALHAICRALRWVIPNRSSAAIGRCDRQSAWFRVHRNRRRDFSARTVFTLAHG